MCGLNKKKFKLTFCTWSSAMQTLLRIWSGTFSVNFKKKLFKPQFFRRLYDLYKHFVRINICMYSTF